MSRVSRRRKAAWAIVALVTAGWRCVCRQVQFLEIVSDMKGLYAAEETLSAINLFIALFKSIY
jgi:copper oxidase (laccase) domain-containing protein